MTPAELELHLVTGMARNAVDELAPDISRSPELIVHLLKLAAGPHRPKNSKAAYLVRHICEHDRSALPAHVDAVLKAMDHAEQKCRSASSHLARNYQCALRRIAV